MKKKRQAPMPFDTAGAGSMLSGMGGPTTNDIGAHQGPMGGNRPTMGMGRAKPKLPIRKNRQNTKKAF